MAQSCVEDAQWKVAESYFDVDPDWEEKERQTKEHLAKNGDSETEGDESLLGRSTALQCFICYKQGTYTAKQPTNQLVLFTN